MKNINLYNVDWTKIPEPKGGEDLSHLIGFTLPDITLPGTGGNDIDLRKLNELTVIYIYPLSGQPNKELPNGWDEIPGARGCTPQSCSFRDNYKDLIQHNVSQVFGLSSQTTSYQKELAKRLNLPYTILSDEHMVLEKELNLPTFHADGLKLFKRITLITKGGKIINYFYPIFPPDKNVKDVLDWLDSNQT